MKGRRRRMLRVTTITTHFGARKICARHAIGRLLRSALIIFFSLAHVCRQQPRLSWRLCSANLQVALAILLLLIPLFIMLKKDLETRATEVQHAATE